MRKSKLKHFGSLVFYIAVFAFWYTTLLQSDLEMPSPGGEIFYLAPLISLPSIIGSLKVVMGGEVFVVDADKKIVLKDNRKILEFDEIKRLQIRTISDSEGSDDYRLAIVKTDGYKIRVEQSEDYDEIAEAASDLADLLRVKVVRKR